MSKSIIAFSIIIKNYLVPLFFCFSSSACGMENDPDYQVAPQIKQAAQKNESSAEDEICPEGWTWRKDFRININGAKNAELTKEIHDLHLTMARKEQWVYSQLRDKAGKIPPVNVAFATIGLILKDKKGEWWGYDTIPFIDPDEGKEMVFLSGQAFGDEIAPSLKTIRERYTIVEPKLRSVSSFINMRMSKDKDSEQSLISPKCLNDYRAELARRTEERPMEEKFFMNLQSLKNPYYNLPDEQKEIFIKGKISRFKAEFKERMADKNKKGNTKKDFPKIFDFIFSILEDAASDSNIFTSKDMEDVEGMKKILDQLETPLRKFLQTETDIGPHIMKWLTSCKTIVSSMNKQVEAPKITSDEFTGHTEQHILYLINNNKDVYKIIKGKIKENLVRKNIAAGILLHFHSRLDVCERCAPSIARELEFVRNAQEDSIFTKLFFELTNINKDISFNILVSSRHQYQDRESGEEGYRRNVSYDGNHEGSINILRHGNKVFMKAMGTFQPKSNQS